jgi:hypothetical protein
MAIMEADGKREPGNSFEAIEKPPKAPNMMALNVM